MTKIYIAGKISGLDPAEVVRKFEEAKSQLIQQGYDPISPIDNGCAPTAEWAEQMMACLPMLLSCDTVAMLPCWNDSEGAKIEHVFAEKAGKEILYLTDKAV